MPHILRNKELEIHIDQPTEGYNFSRFDWTGKITFIAFKDIPVTTLERIDKVNIDHFGRGLYNEFGIDNALGFEEAVLGDWFLKIGVGALRKQTTSYEFDHTYEIRPANFTFDAQGDKIILRCHSEIINGYGYELKKEIRLHDCHLTISYNLKNTGSKPIVTEEYTHNFFGIGGRMIDAEHVLKFPFELELDNSGETVNPEKKVTIENKEIRFSGTPQEQFFFSYLNGAQSVSPVWELEHLKSNIGIREQVSSTSKKINLWGWKHVISPEIFHQISIEAGESTTWSRTYDFYRII